MDKSSKFQDLTGDPVYDHLKTKVLDGVELLGGYIEERNNAGPKEPRKLMHITIKDLSSKHEDTLSYNYKKLMRIHKL